MLGLFRKKEETPEFSFRTPDQNWFEDLLDSIEYTPDMNALQRTQSQLLFVYDEMKVRHPQHKLIDGHTLKTVRPLPTAFTAGKFSLWKKPMGMDTEAVALENEFIQPQITETEPNIFKWADCLVRKTIIKGELYPVLPYRFKVLDRYKQNGVKFYRKRVRIIIPHKLKTWVKDRDAVRETFDELEPHSLPQVTVERAWMYIGEPTYFDPLVDKGLFSTVPRYQHNGGKAFGKTDYYALTGYDYKFHTTPDGEKLVDAAKFARERRSKDCFQLEWSTGEPISK